jgi:thymidylate synthase (FAD)
MTRKTREQVHELGFVELVAMNLDLQSLQGELPSDFTLDHLVEHAARVSYSGSTRVRDRANLLDYLMRHRHTSPFEQVNFTFRIRAPLYIVQQFLRHRTARVNQESARYSVLDDVAYTPEVFRLQDQHNKQASADPVDPEMDEHLRGLYWQATEGALSAYDQLIGAGVSREQARGVIPHATYTTFVWQIDLHNLMHFLNLRLDSHAQAEIRDYAASILALARPWAPLSFDAWENHVRYAITLSRDEQAVVMGAMGIVELERLESEVEASFLSGSRKRELFEKIDSMQANSLEIWEARLHQNEQVAAD